MEGWLLNRTQTENTKSLRCDLYLCANSMVYHIGVWAKVNIIPGLTHPKSRLNYAHFLFILSSFSCCLDTEGYRPLFRALFCWESIPPFLSGATLSGDCCIERQLSAAWANTSNCVPIVSSSGNNTLHPSGATLSGFQLGSFIQTCILAEHFLSILQKTSNLSCFLCLFACTNFHFLFADIIFLAFSRFPRKWLMKRRKRSPRLMGWLLRTSSFSLRPPSPRKTRTKEKSPPGQPTGPPGLQLQELLLLLRDIRKGSRGVLLEIEPLSPLLLCLESLLTPYPGS